MYTKPGTYLKALLLSAPLTYAAAAALVRAPSELLPEVLAIVASRIVRRGIRRDGSEHAQRHAFDALAARERGYLKYVPLAVDIFR
jgi:hypothetical protein